MWRRGGAKERKGRKTNHCVVEEEGSKQKEDTQSHTNKERKGRKKNNQPTLLPF